MESSSRFRATMTTSSRPEVAEVVVVGSAAAAAVIVEEATEAEAVIVVEATEAAAGKWVASLAVSITPMKGLSNLPKGRFTKLLRAA